MRTRTRRRPRPPLGRTDKAREIRIPAGKHKLTSRASRLSRTKVRGQSFAPWPELCSRPGVAFEPGAEQGFAVGRCVRALVLVPVGTVFDGPAVPLAEGVVGPIPAVFLEDFDHVAEVVARAGSPADRAEFADADRDVVVALKRGRRFERTADLVLVPGEAVDRAGVRDARRGVRTP